MAKNPDQPLHLHIHVFTKVHGFVGVADHLVLEWGETSAHLSELKGPGKVLEFKRQLHLEVDAALDRALAELQERHGG